MTEGGYRAPAASLGQGRVNHDETLGIWRRPGWEADPRAYRCAGCGAVVPWSLWREEERAAFLYCGAIPGRCEECAKEEAGHEAQAGGHEGSAVPEAAQDPD